MVLVVDDHALVRSGVRKLFGQRPELALLEAASGSEALALNRVEHPGIIVLDINLPDGSGFELIETLIADNPPVGIVVLSMYSDPVFVSRAFAAGVRGYVTKNDNPDSLIAALDRVSAGEIYLGQIVAEKMALSVVAPQPGVPVRITEKERAILKSLATGKSLAEISHDLGASYKTVANTTAAMRKKLGLRSNVALVKYAIEEEA